MDNCKLSDFGVEELSTNKNTNINGGLIIPPIGLNAIAFQIESWKSAIEGYNDAMEQ
jgi:hypothetical protein